MAKFHIVLHEPEIPGNTGSIGRTCVALNISLILIKPYGFDLSEKAVRRAGLDYWKYVNIEEFNSFGDFIKSKNVRSQEVFFFENNQEQSFYDAGYTENCYLIFGSETKGLPRNVLDQFPDRTFSIPQYSEHIRSLNLSNAATTAAYECLRCLSFNL